MTSASARQETTIRVMTSSDTKSHKHITSGNANSKYITAEISAPLLTTTAETSPKSITEGNKCSTPFHRSYSN